MYKIKDKKLWNKKNEFAIIIQSEGNYLNLKPKERLNPKLALIIAKAINKSKVSRNPQAAKDKIFDKNKKEVIKIYKTFENWKKLKEKINSIQESRQQVIFVINSFKNDVYLAWVPKNTFWKVKMNHSYNKECLETLTIEELKSWND